MADKNQSAYDALVKLIDTQAATGTVTKTDWSSVSDSDSFIKTAKEATEATWNSYEKNSNTRNFNSLLNDTNLFVYSVDKELKRNPFNAVKFFEDRKKQAEELKRRASDLYLYTDSESYTEESYNSMMDFLSNFDTYVDDSLARIKDFSNLWSSEEEYRQHLESVREYESRRDLNVGLEQRRIARMEQQLEDYYAKADESGYDPVNATAAEQTAFNNQLNRIESLEKEITDRRKFTNRAKILQNQLELESAIGREDFAANSGYVSTEAKNAFDRMFSDHNSGYDDAQYEFINNNAAVRNSSNQQNKFFRSLGYDKLEPNEVAIYNYYYATEGKGKAQQYLDTIQETLNARQATDVAAEVGDRGYGAKLAYGFGSGLDQFAQNMENMFNEGYMPPSSQQFAAGIVREGLADTGFKIGGNSLGQIGFDLAQTSGNMAPAMIASTAAGMINPALARPVGAITMGLSSGGGAYQEAINAGYTPEQAREYGLRSGGTEAGMSYLLSGINKLGGQIPQAGIAKAMSYVDDVVKNPTMAAGLKGGIKLGGEMASEGFEEGLTEALDARNRRKALNEDAEVNWGEVGYAGLLGALSAGTMEVAGSTLSKGASMLAGKPSTTQTAETYKAPEAPKMRVSQDGKAIQISTENEIEITDFASIKDGVATIHTSDGVVDYSDVSFATEKQANQFYAVESLPGIDTENANKLLHTIQDADVGGDTETVLGVREAYRLGLLRATESDLAKSDASVLAPDVRKAIYDIAQDQRRTDALVSETARRTDVKPSKGYQKVVLEGKVKLNDKTMAEVDIMDRIADEFSKTIVHVYQSYKRGSKFYYRDNNGVEHLAPNGKYVNDEIWVDLNAGDKGEGLALNTFAHEMYHHIERRNKAKAQAMTEFVVRELGIENVDEAIARQIDKARDAGYGEEYFIKNPETKMTREQAENEVYKRAVSDFMADSLETMFTKGNVSESLAKLKTEDRGLYDEIKAFVSEWLNKLKQYYHDKTLSKEGKMVAKLEIEKFEKLQQMFFEGMQEAGENYQAALELSPGQEGTVVDADGNPVAHATEDGTVDEIQKTLPKTEAEISEEQVVQADRDLEQFSLRNERKSNRDILTQVNPDTRKPNEKGHLRTYQERVAQLRVEEENLKTASEAEAKSIQRRIKDLKSDIRFAERSEMFKRIVSEERAKLDKQQSREALKDYKTKQKESVNKMQQEYRAIRQELTGKETDIQIMEREFIRIAKEHEKLDSKTGKKSARDAETIAQLKSALKEEAKSHREDSKIWEREFNRLLRDYETSGRQIERLEATIKQQGIDAKAKIESIRESQETQKQRKQVEGKAKTLMKMLAFPTKDAHVPMELQQPLKEFLESIDFTSKSQMRGGPATIKDIQYTRALQNVRDAIASQRTAVESEDGLYSLDVPADFIEAINKHIKMVNDATKGLDTTTNRVYEMSSAELKDMSYLLTVINKAIRDIDKLHMQGEKARTSEFAKDTMQEMKRRPQTKTESGNQFMWDNYTPYHAFRRMGKAAQKIFTGLTNGQGKLARTIDSTIKFTQKTYTAEEVRSWERERMEVKLDSGEKVFMTPAQVMTFWCLSRRNQAVPHMQGAGIRITTLKKAIEGANVVKEVVQRDHYTLTLEDVNRINSLLTDRQIEVAKALQQYMQRVGGKLINEISMARWDFMAATETDYFPIATDDTGRDVKNPDQNRSSLFALLNKNFTKAPVKGAKNALVIGSIFDVFANHMSEVAEYNAFALPLIDAMKWFNYRERIDIGEGHIKDIGVHKSLKDTLGTSAVKYFTNLMTDINSSQKAGRHEDFFGKILGRSKAASVGWNLRVAIQQISALPRASMILSPASLYRGVTEVRLKDAVKEMQKYSGIALWKSMGYYDLNVSRSVTEQIKGDNSLTDKFNKAGMWLPGKMDEIVWAKIWIATRDQVQRDTNLTEEALLQKTAEKFESIVYQTQVADSVLTRSSYMRSKSHVIKEATSFMSEPTLSLNILLSAFQDYEEGHTNWDKAKRGLMIGFTGYTLAGVANALLASFVDALRDDDEFETYWEKYGQALLGEDGFMGFMDGNLFNEMNPAGKIIFVKDVLSILQGYESGSSFSKIVSGGKDLVDAIAALKSGKTSKTTYGVIYQALQYLSTASGVGVSNLTREVVDIWNNTFAKLYPEMRVVRYKPKNGEELLAAIQTGKEEDIQRVFGRFENQQKAESALQSAIKAKYLEDGLTKEETEGLLDTYFDRDEYEVYWLMDEWDYAKENGTSDGYNKYNSLYEAIDSGDYIETVNRYLEHGMDESDIRTQISKNYRKQYLAADETQREEIQDKLLPVYLDTGWYESDVQKKFNDWDFEAEYGMTYSTFKNEYREGFVTETEMRNAMKFYGLMNYEIEEDIRDLKDEIKFQDKFGMSLSEMRDAFDNGDLSESQLINALVFTGKTTTEATEEVKERKIENRMGIEYAKLDDAYKHGDISRQTFYNAMREHGATQKEADEAIVCYDWLKKNVKKYPDLAVSDARRFVLRVSDKMEERTLTDYGVSVDTYLEYKVKAKDCPGEDLDGDGYTDAYSKAKQLFAMIDTLPISNEAKDGLALVTNAESTLRKYAPWR